MVQDIKLIKQLNMNAVRYNRPVLLRAPPYVLRVCYKQPGTVLGFAVLRVCYAVSGTNLGDGGTRLSHYPNRNLWYPLADAYG